MLAGWNVSGLTDYGPSPYPATTNGPNLSVIGLARGSGVKTNSNGATGGWGGFSFTNLSAATAIASNVFVTFGLSPSNGYKISYSAISRFDYRRSSTGPTNTLLQFQVGAGSFTDVMTISNSAASGGATNASIDLSGFAALQNVATNVTFRLVNYNGGSAGTWYVWDYAGSSSPDLIVQGTVTQVVMTNPPAIAPSFTQVGFINNQFQFTLAGTAGSNYVVQASTNLNLPTWLPITTNAVPFTFSESNLLPQRFYRALVAP